MTDITKITLSDKELSLVTNADWILTKHEIIQKVYNLFAEKIPAISAILNNPSITLPDELKTTVPKIYKGENYLQLPYVMLDYPRCFNGKDIFSIRTMFWWGNFFSITLHISGKYELLLKDKLMKSGALLNNGFFIGINEDQWEHHFEASNYLPVQQLSIEQQHQLLAQYDFTKIALKFELHDWNRMQVLLQEGYQKIAAILA